jgi:hypothetical protein
MRIFIRRVRVHPAAVLRGLIALLLAFAVAGTARPAAARPAAGQPVTYFSYYSLESYNFAGYFARHRNYLGELTTVSSTLDRDDATWLVVPGLAGTGISLRSKNYPSFYLRHANWRLQISQSDGSTLFREDATFHVRPGNASTGSTWMSLESYNYPGHFIRHANYHLWLSADDGTSLFDADSTWSPGPPLS